MSVFLQVPTSAWVASNTHAFAFRDRYPVSPGHTLVVTRRAVPDWFAATPEERADVLALVDVVKQQLDEAFHPAGYNVGFNAGSAAGQTVFHLHVHVIPRFDGDVADPRGGVRHVIPGKGNYLVPTPGPGPDPAFVEKVLTLLDEAHFTTTYKLAVLLGLIDLCLEQATAEGAAPVSVTTTQLAEKVLETYWRQSTPYRPDRDARVLHQNSDPRKPAAILAAIDSFRQQHAPDPSTPLARVRNGPRRGRYEELLREVERTLIVWPLPRVQILGRGEEDRFLYEIDWSVREPVRASQLRTGDFDNLIRFKPGAAEQLVTLASALRPLIQRRWAAKVAQLNDDVLEDAHLEAFLFGAARVASGPVRDQLVALHAGCCFYCDDPVGRGAEVDHFIAWARHPDDGVDNLVPACRRCNGDKSDHLAAGAHLARWVERTRRHAGDLAEIARRTQWDRREDPLAVARAIYLRVRADVRLWRSPTSFEPANPAQLRSALAG